MDNRLIQSSNYNCFRRKQRIRVIFSLCIIIFFWLFRVSANNPKTECTALLVLDVILFLLTIIIIYFVYISFIEKPNIKEGIIIDMKTHRRTVRRIEELENRVEYLYKIKCQESEVWGKVYRHIYMKKVM